MKNTIKEVPSKFQELFDAEISKRDAKIARQEIEIKLLKASEAANERAGYDRWRPTCWNCGSIHINTTWEKQEVPYGCETKIVLSVLVPVRYCPTCKESFTDWEGEELRDEATKPLRLAGIK